MLWARVDSNGNGNVSLAEIDLVVVARYPLLNNKPALMRAYKQTCLADGGDGDAWVEPKEFPMLLVNLFYFNKMFRLFADLDSDGDRRLDRAEFNRGLRFLDLDLSEADVAAEWQAMDADGSGKVP